jgi:hypothetical protein
MCACHLSCLMGGNQRNRELIIRQDAERRRRAQMARKSVKEQESGIRHKLTDEKVWKSFIARLFLRL